MGRLRTEEMLEYGGFELALRDHLRANHFPPIVDGEGFARLAIDAVAGDCPERIVVDAGRKGRAGDVVESWHLEPFVVALHNEVDDDV